MVLRVDHCGMVIDVDTARLKTIGRARAFLGAVCDVQVRTLSDDGERRYFMERASRWFGYFQRTHAAMMLLAELLSLRGTLSGVITRTRAQWGAAGV